MIDYFQIACGITNAHAAILRKVTPMENEMSTWWYAGLLIGMTQMANNENYSPAIRRMAVEKLKELEDYKIDDKKARRIDENSDL